MTRNMFISTHNHWFSRFALLASVIVLVEISLGTYYQLLPTNDTLKISIASIQSYLFYSISVITLFSTIITWYLQRELTIKPFFISLILLLLIAIQYFAPSWAKILLFIDHLILIQTIINLGMLALFWSMKSITSSSDHTFINESDKKYRLWLCLGLLLLFLQIVFTAWATVNHVDNVCNNLFSCSNQFISAILNFHALGTYPLNQEALITLYFIANTIMLMTMIYLLILSISVTFSRMLGEKGILLFFVIIAEMSTAMTEILWHKSFWLSFSRDILFSFVVLVMTSLLIDLFKRPAGAYR